jgi:hypothetical protein
LTFGVSGAFVVEDPNVDTKEGIDLFRLQLGQGRTFSPHVAVVRAVALLTDVGYATVC